MQPIQGSYAHVCKVMATSLYGGIPQVVQYTAATLSKDLVNQLISSFKFTLEDAEQYFNQFSTVNNLQHGSKIEVYLNDISGGASLDPVPVNGWIKKFTGYIIDPDISAQAGQRSISITAMDRMWAVANAKARVINGTPVECISARLAPASNDDGKLLVFQLYKKDGTPYYDLDERTQPIITSFIRYPDIAIVPFGTMTSTYLDPKPRSRMIMISPSDYDVNYSLGRIVFKQPQTEIYTPDSGWPGYPNTYHLVKGFIVSAARYYEEGVNAPRPYLLENALQDFMESPVSLGGTHMTFGVDFDFFDIDGDSKYTGTFFVKDSVNLATNTFTLTATGDHRPSFPDGSHFSVGNTIDNHYNFTVKSTYFSGGKTGIVTIEDVTALSSAGTNLYLYATTGILISHVDWDEDSGIGTDFIAMLRENGSMPYNYFMHCDENSFIRCEYVFQSKIAERSISGELVVHFPNSINDVFTRCNVVSNGNTYPKKLIDVTPGTGNAGYTIWNYSKNNNVALPFPNINTDPDYIKDVCETCDVHPGGDWVRGWQQFGTLDKLMDEDVLTYFGIISGVRARFNSDPGKDPTLDHYKTRQDFYYPFPNVPPFGSPPKEGGQDDLLFFDIIFNDEIEIDKLVLQMYIPRFNDTDGKTKPALYTNGDSSSGIPGSTVLTYGGFYALSDGILKACQTALLSVSYGRTGDSSPDRGLGKDATVFEMDPMKSDAKIIQIDKTIWVKSLRVVFHRPFVADVNYGPLERVAIYMLNSFQAYNRGTIYLPGVDSNGRNALPFCRLTGTDVDSSLLNPPQAWPLTIAPIDKETFKCTLSTLDVTGCFVCIPDADNEVFISEVLNTVDNGDGTMNVTTICQTGRTHTDLLLAGADSGDVAYFMHNRYYLDLLYNRIDLYKPQLFAKMQALHLEWKTKTIENEDIVTLAACLREATSQVKDAISNFAAIEVSLSYRPDYDVGMTVNEPVFNSPKYFVTALDYVVNSSGIICNAKLINFDQQIS